MSQTSTLDEVTAAGGVITDDRPVDFHALGLAGCIDRLTIPLRQGGTSVRWETPHHGIEIPAACAALLYHAAQETLSNAFKYAHATELTVRLAAVYHGIRLTITDNGIGFESQFPGSRHHGFGVRLMTIAVREAGGTIAIDAGPGNGTHTSDHHASAGLTTNPEGSSPGTVPVRSRDFPGTGQDQKLSKRP